MSHPDDDPEAATPDAADLELARARELAETITDEQLDSHIDIGDREWMICKLGLLWELGRIGKMAVAIARENRRTA